MKTATASATVWEAIRLNVYTVLILFCHSNNISLLFNLTSINFDMFINLIFLRKQKNIHINCIININIIFQHQHNLCSLSFDTSICRIQLLSLAKSSKTQFKKMTADAAPVPRTICTFIALKSNALKCINNI